MSEKYFVPSGTGTTKTLFEIMADYERFVIVKALERNGWSRTMAARSLGIRRGHLYERISRLGIVLVPVVRGRGPREEGARRG